MNDSSTNYKYQITLVDDGMLYKIGKYIFFLVVDAAIHLKSKSTITKSNEISEIFIFSDGVLVFWNIEHSEVKYTF